MVQSFARHDYEARGPLPGACWITAYRRATVTGRTFDFHSTTIPRKGPPQGTITPCHPERSAPQEREVEGLRNSFGLRNDLQRMRARSCPRPCIVVSLPAPSLWSLDYGALRAPTLGMTSMCARLSG